MAMKKGKSREALQRQYYARAIERFEYDNNYLGKTGSKGIKVVNVRVKKDVVIADVSLVDYEEGTRERFNNLSYNKSMFGKTK